MNDLPSNSRPATRRPRLSADCETCQRSISYSRSACVPGMKLVCRHCGGQMNVPTPQTRLLKLSIFIFFLATVAILVAARFRPH